MFSKFLYTAFFSSLLLNTSAFSIEQAPVVKETIRTLGGSMKTGNDDVIIEEERKKLLTKTQALRQSLDIIRPDTEIKQEAEEAFNNSLAGYKQIIKGAQVQELAVYTKYVEDFMKDASIVLSATPGPPAAVGVFLGVAAKPTAAGIKRIMENWGMEAQTKGLRKVEAKNFTEALASEKARLSALRERLVEKRQKRTDINKRSKMKKMLDKTYLTSFKRDADEARAKYDGLIKEVDQDIESIARAENMTGTIFQVVDMLYENGILTKEEYDKLIRTKLLHRFDERKIYFKHQIDLITQKMIEIREKYIKRTVKKFHKIEKKLLITLAALLAEKHAMLGAVSDMKKWYRAQFTN